MSQGRIVPRPRAASVAVGVGQPVNDSAMVCKFMPPCLPDVPAPVPLLAVGVGKPARVT